MPVVNTTNTFTNNEQITSAKLNGIMDNSSFVSGAVVTSGGLQITAGGQMQIASNGVTTEKILNSNVTTDKIANSNVTTAKLADDSVTSAKLAPNITITSLTAGTVTSTGTLIAGQGIGASDANVLIGYNRTTAGNSGIFFYTDSTLGDDAYIRRTSGTNGNFTIVNYGTGSFTNTGSARYGYNIASPLNTHHFVGGIRNTSPNAAGTGSYLVIDASGDIKALGSSLRYKNSIEDYNKGLKELKQLRPVTYKFNGEDVVTAGFIAEEVDAIGMDEYVIKNSEGQPDALNYGQMVALLVNAIKEQQQQIDELKAKVQ
jgi:hypothetical protein